MSKIVSLRLPHSVNRLIHVSYFIYFFHFRVYQLFVEVDRLYDNCRINVILALDSKKELNLPGGGGAAAHKRGNKSFSACAVRPFSKTILQFYGTNCWSFPRANGLPVWGVTGWFLRREVPDGFECWKNRVLWNI